MTALALFLALVVGHAVADYPLQGEFLAKAKNHRAPIAGIDWRVALFMHAVMHGGTVAFLTHSMVLGALETLVHMAIDYAKCDGAIDFRADQGLHLACKVLWAALALGGGLL